MNCKPFQVGVTVSSLAVAFALVACGGGGGGDCCHAGGRSAIG